MTFRKWTTPASLSAFLAVSSCAVPGDFCEVVIGAIEFEPETALQMTRTDRPSVEQIALQNEYGYRHCGW